MSIESILNTIVPGRAKREAKKETERKLDKELTDSFPGSDTPAAVQPGSGITGADVKALHPSPSQIEKGIKPN
ncbi:hypothetical protein OSH11_21090 [Kaistia dalseonensis]|uniref:Uncharacterized protein n=1 Tax=Kaistia dalseonensis TaxID=410840 RepID=A0ABU0HD17_9HYPH|nr:hypothetical protein [Kaistia dalseonensis]MCX5497211.1 hypothetical protein [Kaistia dalseonensis]MDQ0439842.1 hypothetical protein [Kaistia dalseonensis]